MKPTIGPPKDSLRKNPIDSKKDLSSSLARASLNTVKRTIAVPSFKRDSPKMAKPELSQKAPLGQPT